MEGGSGGVERFPEGWDWIFVRKSSWFSSQFQVFQRRKIEEVRAGGEETTIGQDSQNFGRI